MGSIPHQQRNLRVEQLDWLDEIHSPVQASQAHVARELLDEIESLISSDGEHCGGTQSEEVPCEQSDWKGRHFLAGSLYRARRHRATSNSTKVDAERWLVTNSADMAKGESIDPDASRVLFVEWASSWSSISVDLRPSTRPRDVGS